MASAIEDSGECRQTLGWMEKVPSRLDRLVEGEGTPGTPNTAGGGRPQSPDKMTRLFVAD
ncbi:hypothetical protein E4U30_004542 [Claviceps sp. LM220 group G6]|nr:hypothetical protein E4U30_004542 [Claviceps sp. LM220 group G6]